MLLVNIFYLKIKFGMVFVICYVKLLILYIMLSITNTEFKNYGCPNCGCDTLKTEDVHLIMVVGRVLVCIVGLRLKLEPTG